MNDSVDSMMDRKPGLSNISEFSSLDSLLLHVPWKGTLLKITDGSFFRLLMMFIGGLHEIGRLHDRAAEKRVEAGGGAD